MSRITAADMKTVRMINGVTKMDRIRNFDLCKRLNITPNATKIKKTAKLNGLVM